MFNRPRFGFIGRAFATNHPQGLHGRDGANDSNLDTKGPSTLPWRKCKSRHNQSTDQDPEGSGCSARELGVFENRSRFIEMATKSSPVSAAAAPIVPKKKSCQVKGLYEAMIKLCTYEGAVHPSPRPKVPQGGTQS